MTGPGAGGGTESLRARLAQGGVALIVNRSAKRMRTGSLDATQLRGLVELHGQAFEPGTLEELAGMAHEVRARDPGLIAICGGDGTYQKTITALLHAYGGHPLPVLLPLAGGTFNVLTTALGVRGNPVKVLTRAMAQVRAAPRGRPALAALADSEGLAPGRGGSVPHLARMTTVPILQVSEEAGTLRRQWGFIFANGVISRIIARYTEGPPSTARAARVFSEAVGGFMMQTPAARELTRRHAAVIEVDGEPFQHGGILGMLAGTIQPTVLGFTPFSNRKRLRNSFNYAIGALDASEAIGLLPALVRGRAWGTHPGLRNATAREIRIDTDEGFILDGDVYPSGVSRRLTLSVGPRLRFLRP